MSVTKPLIELEATGMLLDIVSGRSFEDIERDSQRRMNASERFPIKWNYAKVKQSELEAIGFEFGETVDDLFRMCKLPAGWTKRASSHQLWSYIDDANGCERVSIFYKSAFYDREAFASFTQRYHVTQNSDNYDHGTPVRCVVKDNKTKTIVFQTDEYKRGEWEISDAMTEQCRNWLNTNFPNYQNELAYWEDPVVTAVKS